MDTEQGNTYVLDGQDGVEIPRLILQDQIVTEAMGGVFPEYPHNIVPTKLQRVIDIGCGPGEWALEVADQHMLGQVVAIDSNPSLIAYVAAQAKIRRLKNFIAEVGNILQGLSYPDGSFGLVNARFINAVILRQRWPQVIQEYYRLVAPGGIIRLTETDTVGTTTSEHVQQLFDWLHFTLNQIGYGFSKNGRDVAITHKLRRFLLDVGCHDIHMKPHIIDNSFGSPSHTLQLQNHQIFFQELREKIVHITQIPMETYDDAYHGMMIDMRREDYCGANYFLTVWGTKPL